MERNLISFRQSAIDQAKKTTSTPQRNHQVPTLLPDASIIRISSACLDVGLEGGRYLVGESGIERVLISRCMVLSLLDGEIQDRPGDAIEQSGNDPHLGNNLRDVEEPPVSGRGLGSIGALTAIALQEMTDFALYIPAWQ